MTQRADVGSLKGAELKGSLLALLVLVMSCKSPQETLWQDFNDRSVELYEQEQYSEAIKLAEEALKMAENTS